MVVEDDIYGVRRRYLQLRKTTPIFVEDKDILMKTAFILTEDEIYSYLRRHLHW